MSTMIAPPADSAADGVPPPEDAPERGDGERLTKGEAGGVLDELHATFEQMQALSRRAVQLIQDLNGSGQVEAIEGLPLMRWFRELVRSHQETVPHETTATTPTGSCR